LKRNKVEKIEESIFKFFMVSSLVLLIMALLSITIAVFVKGYNALSLKMIFTTPKGGYYLGKEGGILNAILGSIIIALSATILSFIYSFFIVFYINVYRYSKSNFLKCKVPFRPFVGIPSIVYGAFGFAIMLIFKIPASMIAGIITLSFVILPIMARTMDETLRMIPFELKQVGFSLGANQGLKFHIK